MYEWLSQISSQNILRYSNNYSMAYPSIIHTEHFCFKSYTLLSDSEHKTIWQIRNDPGIRMYMDNSEPFPFEGHQKFVTSLLQNSEKAYYGVYEILGGKLIGNQCIVNSNIEKLQNLVNIFSFRTRTWLWYSDEIRVYRLSFQTRITATCYRKSKEIQRTQQSP